MHLRVNNETRESWTCRCVAKLHAHQCINDGEYWAIQSSRIAVLLGVLRRTQMREERVSADTHIRTVSTVRVHSARSDEPRHLMHASAGTSAARLGALEQPHRRVRCQRF